MATRAKKAEAPLMADAAGPSLEQWIQKKGPSPWQPGYFKSERPAAKASEAYARFCAESKPSRWQRDASAAWALWQACLDSTELLALRTEEGKACRAKGRELQSKCEQLERDKRSLEAAWEAEKRRRGAAAPSPVPKQAEVQGRCVQLEREKAEWESQRQGLKAELRKIKQELQLGQKRLAALFKANHEDRETCRQLRDSYTQCQAEMERLRKESGTRRGYGPAAGRRPRRPRTRAPERLATQPPAEATGEGQSAGFRGGQQARRCKGRPRRKRRCRVCGAWGRAERRGGAWQCPRGRGRGRARPWRGHSAARGGPSFPRRDRAAAAASFPTRAPGMPEPGTRWRPAAVSGRGPPGRGPYLCLPWRRGDGSRPSPGVCVCHRCQVSIDAHRAGCYRCRSPKVTAFTPESEPAFRA